eukprot:gene46347-56752_t
MGAARCVLSAGMSLIRNLLAVPSYVARQALRGESAKASNASLPSLPSLPSALSAVIHEPGIHHEPRRHSSRRTDPSAGRCAPDMAAQP